jgi:hypothetical protein
LHLDPPSVEKATLVPSGDCYRGGLWLASG